MTTPRFGLYSSKSVIKNLRASGFLPDIRFQSLNLNIVRQFDQRQLLSVDRELSTNILSYYDSITTKKTTRLSLGYPCRGQRTQDNAKTAKKRLFVSSFLHKIGFPRPLRSVKPKKHRKKD